MNIQINSPEQMFELGEKIGRQLKPSDVVVLNGELGAGKTVLTQGIASAFKILGVTSPTFVISRIHKGNPNFIHIDAYRLLDSNPSNFADLDFESYLASSVFVIEWGKDFVSTLTDQYLEINIDRGQKDDQRQVEFVMVGDRWDNFKL
ncbi:tRNA threonylcarbamoyladenosine biosynthesis protein TsaE [Candidatus Nanopelagicus limnes]|uniref:tRNA threonylcarbamoyladenosine biosynthesis protein TsaE n=1 Tax=Candidatus Nanopelagicus limnae TaxID=1884634 RepID=A0A249JWQ1_9ACTN|nr:tRNA (adenosine(37)-N6)-threonylcarbamoyltransferase complex ATPase subunit type 1 TsaE [Candidatus Nanopelagicus limnes]ASY08950.1 tRNA threonylcarbamoyladenosine biosynthesis protein TsaE [Candidatus Nanopelagicus limnes]